LYESLPLLYPHSADRTSASAHLGSHCPLSQSDKRDFNVFFTARNGAYMQFLRLRRVQHEWRQAARVIVDEKVVFEKVDKDFPKDQLDWTSNETAEPILPSE
jgi:hypothetical protein